MNLRPEALESLGRPDDVDAVARLLLGKYHGRCELPPLEDLTAAVIALARGTRRKVLLPLGAQTAEFALLRRGPEVLVSWYRTGQPLEVEVLDRPVQLASLLELCIPALQHLARQGLAVSREETLRLAARASTTVIAADRHQRAVALQQKGGISENPGEAVPLAFGYSATILPNSKVRPGGSLQSDAHALLFGGSLWAYVRGQRLLLCDGPIVLPVGCMLRAARAVTEAWEANKPCQVRMQSGSFQIGARLAAAATPRRRQTDRRTAMLQVPQGNEESFCLPQAIEARYISEPQSLTDELALVAQAKGPSTPFFEVELSLGRGQQQALTAKGLDVSEVVAPILRLASSLLRTLVQVDRSQSRNLRVRELRKEVRELRRMLRGRRMSAGFLNGDPEQLRMHSLAAATQNPATNVTAVRPMFGDPSPGLGRYTERWGLEIDALDVDTAFLCGERLIIGTPRHVMALHRNDGRLLWSEEGSACYRVMGNVLLRVIAGSHTELWDIERGDHYATAPVFPRRHNFQHAIAAGGGHIPPVAILHEDDHALVAIDLRNGEPRWRFAARSEHPLGIQIVGRVLVVGGDTTLHAIDIATGEVAWRFTDGSRFLFGPTVCEGVVITTSVCANEQRGCLSGIDLYTGSLLWRRHLDAIPCSRPTTAGTCALVGLGTGDSDAHYDLSTTANTGSGPRQSLAAFSPQDGSLRWMVPDPGMYAGGASLTLERDLIIHSQQGHLQALALGTGETRWELPLGNTTSEELPRHLKPSLYGGALFVPSASVRIVHPYNGTVIGSATPADLMPDRLLVDERGWVFVAEESGYLSAHAPTPKLTMVRGGK